MAAGLAIVRLWTKLVDTFDVIRSRGQEAVEMARKIEGYSPKNNASMPMLTMFVSGRPVVGVDLF